MPPSRCLHRARSVLPAGVTLALIMIVGYSSARAQPRIHVRASTRLELGVQRAPSGAALEGVLLDDAGLPLTDREVELSTQDEGSRATSWRTLRTSENGAFAAPLISLSSRRGRVLARFAGDADHAATELAQHFDLGQAEVQLRFLQPRDQRLDLDAANSVLNLAADSPAGAGDLEVEIVDESARPIAHGTTRPDGVLRTRVQSAALGQPGVGRLIARTPGDTLRHAAQAQLQVLRFRHSELTLRAALDPKLGRLLSTGTLRTRSGPLAGRAVGLFDGPAHVATITTDSRGEFRHAGIAPAEPGGAARSLRLQARFDSETAWLASSRSAIVNVRLVPDPATSPLWFLLPVGLCALLFWLLGRGGDGGRASTPRPLIGPGLHVGFTAYGDTASRNDVMGTVIDHVHEHAICRAVVSLTSADGTHSVLTTDAVGRFRSPSLTAGPVGLHVTAPGYGSLAETLSVPRRGQLHIRLVSLRTAAVLATRPLATRALASRELWGRWTPREALAHALHSQVADEAWIRLTERVERAAYAQPSPSEAEVGALEREARSLGQTSDPPATAGASRQPPASRFPGRR